MNPQNLAFEAQFKTGQVTVGIAHITPHIASELLRSNTKNRKMRERGVFVYRSDMAAGKWKFTADPIRFHKNGTLIDGQHRLTAISQMPDDFSVKVLVVLGLDDEAQLTMDQGRKRTAADQLSIKGNIANAALVAATAKTLLVLEHGVMFRDNKLKEAVGTHGNIIEWCDNNPHFVEIINTIASHSVKSMLSPSTVCAAAIVAAAFDEDESVEMVSQLATGENMRSDDPIMAMRNRAISNRVNKKKVSERDQLGLLLRAFEARFAGKKMQKIQLPLGATFTESQFPKELVENYLHRQGIARLAGVDQPELDTREVG